MYNLRIEGVFSSAHNLRGYKGKCEELHGHNWKVEVESSSRTLSKVGMVLDFKEIQAMLGEVLEDLDHKNLNDIDYFKKVKEAQMEIPL